MTQFWHWSNWISFWESSLHLFTSVWSHLNVKYQRTFFFQLLFYFSFKNLSVLIPFTMPNLEQGNSWKANSSPIVSISILWSFAEIIQLKCQDYFLPCFIPKTRRHISNFIIFFYIWIFSLYSCCYQQNVLTSPLFGPNQM